MEIALDLSPTTRDIEEIRSHLRAFSDEHLDGVTKQPVALYVYNNEQEKVAGVTAEIFGRWLHVQLLWVTESLRGSNMGTHLLKQLEAHAVSQGCQYSHVETFSFQARPFYEKIGYSCQMTLENYPVSTAVYYLVKDLR
ncbi:GNAT family N-acetyltransferase [Vibrio ouci]|nr:GNAT family N-acetyltransferase [Vibrio ouci]